MLGVLGRDCAYTWVYSICEMEAGKSLQALGKPRPHSEYPETLSQNIHESCFFYIWCVEHFSLNEVQAIWALRKNSITLDTGIQNFTHFQPT